VHHKEITSKKEKSSVDDKNLMRANRKGMVSFSVQGKMEASHFLIATSSKETKL